MALREILVELGIDVDDKGADKAIDRIRHGLKRMAAQEKKATTGLKKMSSALGSLRNAAIGLGAIFLTGGLARGFGAMLTTAGDAVETINKFGAVFVEETDSLAKQLEQLAINTGQSSNELKGLAADAGSLVKPLVGSTEAAADLAKQMTEAALDISSFENVLPTDALGAMKSALIGSSEPMLRYGIDTRKAALAQFALDKGLKKQIKEMKSAQITALRMELIMKRLGEKGAVGDAEKTAGSYTNKLRAAEGAFKDLVIEVGHEFLPVATDVLNVMINLARTMGPGLAKAGRVTLFVFRAIGNVLQSLLVPFERLDSALLFLASVVLPGLAISFKLVGVAATWAGIKAAGAWLLATIPLILMGVLIAALGVAIFLLIDDIMAMGKGYESVTGTMINGIDDLIGKHGDLGTAIGEMLDTALRWWLQYFGKTKEEADEWVKALTDTLTNFWSNILDAWGKLFAKFWDGLVSFIKGGGLATLFVDTGEEGSQRRSDVEKNLTRGVGEMLAVGAAGTISPTLGSIASAAAGGLSSIISQPTNNMDIQVDASNQEDPAAIGAAVGDAVVAAVNENERRNTIQSYAVESP